MVLLRQRAFHLGFNLATILLAGWNLLEFLTRGATQVTETTTQLYLIVLAVIIGDKEVARWHGHHRSARRRGEFFVIGWALLLLGMVVVEMVGGAEHGWVVARQMPITAGTVVVVWLLSAYLKAERQWRAVKARR